MLWGLGFPLGRLGHSWGYLYGKDGIRGLFMTISLLSQLGMVTYLILGAFF